MTNDQCYWVGALVGKITGRDFTLTAGYPHVGESVPVTPERAREFRSVLVDLAWVCEVLNQRFSKTKLRTDEPDVDLVNNAIWSTPDRRAIVEYLIDDLA